MTLKMIGFASSLRQSIVPTYNSSDEFTLSVFIRVGLEHVLFRRKFNFC